MKVQIGILKAKNGCLWMASYDTLSGCYIVQAVIDKNRKTDFKIAISRAEFSSLRKDGYTLTPMKG